MIDLIPIGRAVGIAVLLVVVAACEPPFQLGQPTTRELETGASGSLSNATSFTLRGTYLDASGAQWTINALLLRPDREDVSVTGPGVQVEAILIGSQAYFQGQAFLAQHMGSDPTSQNLARAAGNAWWKGSTELAPQLPDLIGGTGFRSTFLGSAVTQRTDHVSIDGLGAIELSGPRADVYIRATAPHYLLHVRAKQGVVIDGLKQADLDYGNFNRRTEITAPSDVIDFSNLTTLPPIYTVVSVGTSRCGSPCVVSAQLKNLGGLFGATAPSTVAFTMKGSVSEGVIGTCQAQVTPDVGYNATTTVSCTINLSGQPENAAVVTATATNPGRG
ncbi:MAG TPA: hypothetical protein VN834_02225 [Candidatus Acidoferrum sp.]|nr:hypothetical protein [Candidatus Acidoferrum sp.]